MAYVSQERKAELAAEIAKVMPSDWKWTLALTSKRSTLSLTIRQAPVDLISENLVCASRPEPSSNRTLNVYHLNGEYSDKLLKIFENIKGAMMVGNHDNSDSQSDYFDVGWYIDINIGGDDSPFRYVPKMRVKSCRPKYNPMNNIDALKQTMRDADRPKGMPEGLNEAAQIEWMKNRIKQLEGIS